MSIIKGEKDFYKDNLRSFYVSKGNFNHFIENNKAILLDDLRSRYLQTHYNIKNNLDNSDNFELELNEESKNLKSKKQKKKNKKILKKGKK